MWKKIGISAVVGLVMCTSTVSPASAEEKQADQIVETVKKAERDTFKTNAVNADVVESADGDFVASVDGKKVEIPEESDNAVEIETGEGNIEIDLPGSKKKKGKLVGDSVAYSGVEQDLGLVVDTTDNGVRVSAVIETPKASHILDYGIKIPDNRYLQLEDDDSVSVRKKNGKVVNSIAPPWATDTNGNPVQTWYTVKNNVLTQHVKPTAVTAYPVTADPEIHDAWGHYD